MRSASLLLGLLALLLPACTRHAPPGDAAPPAAPFAFALIGDQQYTPEQEEGFVRVMDQIDADDLAFVLHVGDIKGGSAPCTDSLLQARRTAFDRSAHPFVLLFGDNEWTDCHRAGGDPLFQLGRLREAFTQDASSLGRSRINLERQSADPRFALYRENVRWRRGGVLFVGLHVVGSNNNRGRTATMDAEYTGRNEAALAWLRDAFQLARQERLRGVLIAMHANPWLRPGALDAPTTTAAGFDDVLAALQTLVPDFGRPVVLVHGDSHQCRIDRPLVDARTGEPVPSFRRVEVFGYPFSHWIRGAVDPADPALFRFEPLIVPGNPEGPCLLAEAG